MVERNQKPRDTCKYNFKKDGKTVHQGITNDPERREKEHQKNYGKGKIEQVGRRTTREAALKWERKNKK